MDNSVRPLFVLLRILAFAEALVLLLALDWAGTSPKISLVVHLLVQFVVLLVFALWPRSTYSSSSVRTVMIWLAAVAALTAIPPLIADWNSPLEPDVNAMLLRIFTWVLFLAMFLEAKKWKTAALSV